MLAHGFSEYDKKEIDKSFIIFHWVTKENNIKIKKSDKIIIRPFLQKIEDYRKEVFQFMKLFSVLERERGFPEIQWYPGKPLPPKEI